MKKILFQVFLFTSVMANSQKIAFTYDDAGNQIRRYICPNCLDRLSSDSDYKNEETLTSADMIEDSIFEHISYYPNPVREELYVKWENTKEASLEKMELYSMNGDLLKVFSNLKDSEIATLSFSNLPAGFYNLALTYNNGEKRTLKIVKK